METPTANSPEGWAWVSSLGAAAWPLACASVFAAYAFFPERFPAQAGLTLYLFMAAELPMIPVTVAHAVALREATVKARLRKFFSLIAVVALIVLLNMGFRVDIVVVAPLLFWVLAPYAIDLFAHHDDRALASAQVEAVLEDKLHLMSLIPSMVVMAVLLTIATMAVLAGVSIALGNDLAGTVVRAVSDADPSKLALAGSAYYLVGAASAAHAQRPVFLRNRKRLLDRAWIHKASLRRDVGKQLAVRRTARGK